jgi:hypothetical protein
MPYVLLNYIRPQLQHKRLTYLYNHAIAHRLRLGKLFYLELSRSIVLEGPSGYFKPLPDLGGGFAS